MREIVVTRGFNNEHVIGVLQLVDRVEVSFDCLFALGGIVKRSHKNEDGVNVVDDFELLEVSLIKIAITSHPANLLYETVSISD
jgi:hypothetical protein